MGVQIGPLHIRRSGFSEARPARVCRLAESEAGASSHHLRALREIIQGE